MDHEKKRVWQSRFIYEREEGIEEMQSHGQFHRNNMNGKYHDSKLLSSRDVKKEIKILFGLLKIEP